MKIVINDDFGGFSLSPQGLEEYARLKGIEKLYWFRFNSFKMRTDLNDPYEFVEGTPDHKDWMVIAYTDRERSDETSFSSREIPRDDPDLIAVVEKLGDRANGSSASLKIVEIPEDVDWIISEYDGLEHIAENHRTWS